MYATITATSHYLGTCDTCVRPVRETYENRDSDYVSHTCEACNAKVRLARVYATTTTGTCDAGCMGAHGPRCDCPCGGTNHGGAWANNVTTDEITATALAAYRDRIGQKAAREESKRQAKIDTFNAWAADGNTDVVDYLKGVDFTRAGISGFLFDVAAIVNRHDTLTPRQATAVRKFIANEKDRAARDAERAKNATPVPEGKQEVEGEIISIKLEVNPYSGRDDQKMLVDTGTYRVFGTVPRALFSQLHDDGATRAGDLWALKGHKVTFTATLTRSNRDEDFGFFKRPSGAKLVKTNG